MKQQPIRVDTMRGNRCTSSACDALAAEQCNATPHRAIPTYPVQYPRATSTIKNPDSTASVEDTGGSRESSCGARGRRQGLAGLRGDAPSEARGADGERAGRRPPAHTAARPNKTGPAAAEDLSGQQATQSRPAARQPSAKGSAHLGAVGTQAHDHAAFLPRPPRGCGNTLTGTARQRAHARR